MVTGISAHYPAPSVRFGKKKPQAASTEATAAPEAQQPGVPSGEKLGLLKRIRFSIGVFLHQFANNGKGPGIIRIAAGIIAMLLLLGFHAEQEMSEIQAKQAQEIQEQAAYEAFIDEQMRNDANWENLPRH